MPAPVDPADKAAFALRFQTLLKEKFNGEVKRLAKALCLPQSRVQNYLDGKHLPRLRDLCDRCKSAGLDAYALLGIDPPSKEEQAGIPDWAYEDGGKGRGKRAITVPELLEALKLLSPNSFARTEVEIWDRHHKEIPGALLVLRTGLNLLLVDTTVAIARAQKLTEPVEPVKIPEAPSKGNPEHDHIKGEVVLHDSLQRADTHTHNVGGESLPH